MGVFCSCRQSRPVQLLAMNITRKAIPSAPPRRSVFRWRFAFPYSKKHWDEWDNWDTPRKTLWLSGISRPVYAFVTGTRLGQLGHFGIRTFHNGASFGRASSAIHAHLMRPGVWSGSVGMGANPSQRRNRSRIGV